MGYCKSVKFHVMTIIHAFTAVKVLALHVMSVKVKKFTHQVRHKTAAQKVNKSYPTAVKKGRSHPNAFSRLVTQFIYVEL